MLSIIVGTQTGTAEFVADDILELLQGQGIEAQVTLTPETLDINQQQTWLFCTSTHGAGEFPDNLKPFIQQLELMKDLSHISYMIVALGDSSYDTYCFAGHKLEQLLADRNSQKLSELFAVDAMNEELPEDLVIPWLTSNLTKISK